MVELPKQIDVVPVIVIVGLLLTVSTLEAVPEQPFASVTVTLYVPAVLILILCVVDELFHTYELPVGFAVKVVDAPLQIELLPVIFTDNPWLEVNENPDDTVVQPLEFVITTV